MPCVACSSLCCHRWFPMMLELCWFQSLRSHQTSCIPPIPYRVVVGRLASKRLLRSMLSFSSFFYWSLRLSWTRLRCWSFLVCLMFQVVHSMFIGNSHFSLRRSDAIFLALARWFQVYKYAPWNLWKDQVCATAQRSVSRLFCFFLGYWNVPRMGTYAYFHPAGWFNSHV